MMNPNTDSQFSNVQSVPAVAQPATPANSQRIKVTKEYMLSLQGILRALIIVFQFCAWVSAAAVPVLISGQYTMPPEFASTRSAYLFFSIVGFLLGIIFYVCYLMNIVNLNGLNRLPWNIILLILDVVYTITMFVLAIVCAVREGSLKEQPNIIYLNQGYINLGAFGSAAFFGFLLSIIYGVLAAIGIMRVVRGGVSTPNYSP